MGSNGRNGTGVFSGKDYTKVDKAVSYVARCVAKNIVITELTDKCEAQFSYPVGFAKPVSINVNTFDTNKSKEEK